MKWLFIRFSSSLPGLVRGWEGQHHSQALKDCQLAHISCQGATQGENVSDLSACVPNELGFCYLTQWAQPKLSQIAQTLFVHGSEWYFTWEESVFHYIVTYVLLQSQLITAEISKCQFPQTKEKGKNVKLTTHLETYPKCDWFCVSSIYLTIFKKGTYVTENTDKTIFCFPRYLLNFMNIIHCKGRCWFCYKKLRIALQLSLLLFFSVRFGWLRFPLCLGCILL